MTREQFLSELNAGARAMGVPLSDHAGDRMFVYFSELERWNRKINLVSRQQQDWMRVHFLDSLAALSLRLLGEGVRVVDLGAGAGFPGVPLKIAEDSIFLVMAEASGKKCAWLKHLTRALELSRAQVLEGRFEDQVTDGWGGSFDVVVSRAAAKPWKILDLARPFLRPGGRTLIYTTEALAKKGVGRVHPYKVPGSKVPSVIWEVEF